MDFRAFSDEIPPCSFETARRLLWRSTNNELLPVYDRQFGECYLQPQILRCECVGDNKWFLNKKTLIIAQAFTTSITQIWVKPSGIPPIWVNPQIWAITQNWGNHAQITQNWVLHLFLRVVIYLVMWDVLTLMWRHRNGWLMGECLTHLGRATHICVNKLSHHWLRYWLVACSVPSHYLN